jgi:hypothetical protein
MQNPNAFQSFNVYNDQQGNFSVTSIQACLPGPDQVALFGGFDYSGACVVKDFGGYSGPDQIELPDATVASLQVGVNVQAVLCGNLTGLCETFAMDDANLSDNDIGNDQLTWLSIEPIQ